MSTSAQESSAPTSSILQSQAINATTQKRSLAEDGEPTRHQKNKKRRKASNSRNLDSNSSVVAATSVPPTIPATPAVSIQPLYLTNPPLHRRDEKKKKKKKKRKMSIVTNSEFEDDRAKHKHANVSLSITPATVIPQNSVLPRRMKEETEDSSDLEMSVALRNSSEKKKGKEKALPRPPSPQERNLAMSNRHSTPVDAAAQEEIQSLKQQLEAQSQRLKKHKAYLTSMHHSLTCQICLDLLYKPFALAPCGHVTCYGCLVRWFTAPGPGENVPDNQNNNQNNTVPNGIVGNHIYKRKTCPICRARVIERPVEVWAIKDIVNALVRSKLVDIVPSPSAEEASTSTNERQTSQASGSNARTAQDPWQKIFRTARNPYGINPWWHDWVGDADEAPEHVEGELEEVGMYDTEDHVHRCLDCMHEIWGGQCSHCGRAYPGHPEADDDDGDLSDPEEMMEYEEDYTDEEIEYGLTLGEIFGRMYDDDQPTWEYGPEGEEDEDEFFTDEEGADWGDEPAFGGMGAVIWHDAHDEEPGFAHVEEIHDDDEQEGTEDGSQYESSFIDDSEEDRERNSAAEVVPESGNENTQNTARQMGRAVRLEGRGARRVVDSADEGEVRHGQGRNIRRRR